MDAKTIRTIIADINDRQSHLMAKLRRIDDERPQIEAELALNEQALEKWAEALEVAEE